MLGARGRSRAVRHLAIAAVAVLVATACEPPPQVVHYNTTTVAQLTPDRFDTYGFTSTAGGMVARANDANRSDNLRMVGFKKAWPSSVDQEACATWTRGATNLAQPGIALRIDARQGRVRSIIVTNNVLFGAREIFNVHLGDSAAEKQTVRVGSLRVGWTDAPRPWTICGRVQGRIVSLKAWPTADHDVPPAWSDPEHAASFTVPSSWVYAGRPGFYVGHLIAGQELEYSRIEGGPIGSTSAG